MAERGTALPLKRRSALPIPSAPTVWPAPALRADDDTTTTLDTATAVTAESGSAALHARGATPLQGTSSRHQHRALPERQRLQPPLRRLRRRAGRDRHRPPAHPAPPAADRRQGRTPPPDSGDGVGLRPASLLRSRSSPRLADLAAHRQPPPAPHRPRRATARLAGHQPQWSGHPEVRVHSDTGSRVRSNRYVRELRTVQAPWAVGRVGTCADKAVMEAFLSLLLLARAHEPLDAVVIAAGAVRSAAWPSRTAPSSPHPWRVGRAARTVTL